MSVFDWSKAVIEKELFTDGDVANPTEFVREQTKLHSLNKLSGRIFNPYGIINTIGDSNNPFISQLISQGASDILQAGAYDTTNGITFTRTADNNADELFFTDVRDFKNDIDGAGGGFLNTLTRKAVNDLLNRIGQLAGIDLKPTRSILAQTVAYDGSLIDGSGSQSIFSDEMYDEEYSSNSTVELEPIGDQALAYTHDIVSMRSRIEQLIRLKRKVNDGFFAQNVAVKKPQDIIDLENNRLQKKRSNISKLNRIKFVQSLNNLIDSFEQTTSDFWTNRQRNYKAFSGQLPISKTPKLNGNFSDKYKYILQAVYNLDPNESLSDHYDFIREGLWIDFKALAGSQRLNINTDIEDRRQEKLKSTNLKITNLINKDTLPLYTDINKKYKIGSDETKDVIDNERSFSSYSDAHGDDDILDILSESDVIEGTDQNSSQQEIDGRTAGELVYFSLQDIRNNNIIYLQPTLSNITEDTQPTYTDKIYLGRTEALPSYERTVRSINFSFTLSARTPKELIMIYRKLEFMHKLTYPKIDNDFRRSITPIAKITIGDYYKNTGGYLNSFTKSIDNNLYTWETQSKYRVPKTIECSLSFVILHDVMPYINDQNEFDDLINIHNLNLNADV